MASVFRPRGRRNYYLAYFDRATGRRVTRRGYVDKRATEALAVDLERRAARVAAGIEAAVVEPRSLSPLVAEYLRGLRVSDDWLDTTEKRLSKVLPLSTSQLDSKLLDDLDCKGQTYKQYRSTLGLFLKWLAARGYIAAAPTLPTRPLDARRLRAAYTPTELRRLFRHRRYGLLFMAATYTGLRKSELLRLRWEDVEAESLSLPGSETKNREATRLPLHPDLAKRLRVARRSEAEPVFVEFPCYSTLREIQIRYGIERIDTRGRVKDFHSFRYSLATLLAAAGVPLLVAQALMRHRDPRLTASLYKDLSDTSLSDALRRVNC